MQRRIFIKRSSLVITGAGLFGAACSSNTTQSETENSEESSSVAMSTSTEPLYKLSLAQWSLNKALFNPAMQALPWPERAKLYDTDYERVIANSQLNNLQFPQKARDLGFEGVEFVNQFFYNKAEDTQYLADLKQACADAGTQALLIMCDREGELGNPDEAERMKAVESHYKWVDAAQYLGCHSIRVNAQSSGSYEEQQKLAADGLAKLGEYADSAGINVLVENHGGLSSNGEWLAGVMKMAENDRVGTLPDFGNFCVKREYPTQENPNPPCEEEYDRYQGVAELMPYAKAVSAKTHDFNEQGEEAHTDYEKIMRIVLDHGYRGFVGVEYEGSELGEEEGITKTRELLEKVRDNLAAEYQS
ncbi:sugar phosphate isomerase/epimerase family protein [Tunicatimonas pelagia]|uniref:sugar phosphate isomerase/epimerase family protein n=1 Tax=Tunicatimonas pelagia TaxID=931531 RepID=UPI002665A1B4|nr:sugar phosphate isomerase/epimerase family protein [Tunicatimonas pelagia]WKN43631.1 sugar phosphate isomerase/epimerase [Tunicatimonas pelagia]